MPFRPSTVRLEPLQPFGKVSDQVVGVFQADVEAHRGAFGLPFSRGADGRRIDGEGKRFKPAPGKADAEQFQPVDQRGGRGHVLSLQDKAEKAGRAVEVARPKLMAGAGRSEERRVEKEGVRTCRSRGAPYPSKKKT